jgi:hypothetical protein
MPNTPSYLPILFLLTVAASLGFFFWVLKNSGLGSTRKNAPLILLGLIVWVTIQSLLGYSGLYANHLKAMPPKIMLFGIFPAILTILLLLISKKGKAFINQLPLFQLTLLNLVRVPVEIVLYLLFLNQLVPELMTFAGRNFDILAGISAPLLALIWHKRGNAMKQALLIWNFVCLGLLLNIIFYGLLSAPTPLQQFALDQPNIALLYFPYCLLPTVIVPLVLFGHLVSIKQLL